LHGFALSVLVDERNYPALSNYINNTHLGRRLVYYRTGYVEQRAEKPVKADSIVLKLNVKDGNYADWLRTEIRLRFDYACVESVNVFRTEDRALTHEGQVKHSKIRHEKDDRRNVNDRRHWILGFDNQEKLALFQEQAHEQALIVSECDAKLNSLSNRDRENRSRAMHCQTLVNLQWQEIDVVPLLQRISDIENSIRKVREGNTALQEIARLINEQKALVSQAEDDLSDIKAEHKTICNKIKEDQDNLDKLKNDPSIVPLTPHQQKGLDERYARHTVRLDNLDRVMNSVNQTLNNEVEVINRSIADCEKKIESVFVDFKRTWPMDSGDLDTTLSSATDFFAKLERLETDGLPAHEERFFKLLQDQSHQNLAALSTYLIDARNAIMERMALVNEGLSQVPFNETASQRTFLKIEAGDRQLPEVQEFKQNIKQALSHAWSEEREFAEERFLALRKLVDRLSGLENDQKRWRDSVLDVRQHVEFIGREIDEDGVEVEVYRSGAGKSGGQRQKLATTCLAAALRYQLGGNDHGVPMYAPVVLDEAFSSSDNEFTTLSMNIFKNFGFQMIVATPLKSVMTLEPFISGACFVDINDRRVSSVLIIEYDNDRQRLSLPEQTHQEESEETVEAS
jgi:uncharacterized protein YPO0396